MSSPIALEIAAGPLRGKQPTIQLSQGLRFVQETIAIPQPARLEVGRALDCQICLPADDDQVSRHHFLLEIGPSSVRVRDGGSRNGTFVNGRALGKSPGCEPVRSSQKPGPVELELQDGDLILAGQTVFRVRIGNQAGHAEPMQRPEASAAHRSCRWPGVRSRLGAVRHDARESQDFASAPEPQQPVAVTPRHAAGGEAVEAEPIMDPNGDPASAHASARLFRLLLQTTGLVERRSVIS